MSSPFSLTHFFNQLSIRVKVSALLMTCLGGLMLFAGITLFFGKSISETSHRVSHVQFPASRAMSDLDMMHDGLRAVAFRAMLLAEHPELGDVKEAATELDEFITLMNDQVHILDSLPVSKKIKDDLEASREDLKTYQASSRQLLELAMAGKNKEARGAIPAYQLLFKKLEKSLGELGDTIAEATDEEIKVCDHEMVEDFEILSILLLSIILTTTLLAMLIIRAISQPLKLTAEALHKVSKGDLTVRLESKGGSEIQAMAEAVNEALENIYKALQNVAKSADSLVGSSDALRLQTVSVSKNATTSSDQATVANTAAQQITENLNTVASASEEMQVTIKEISVQTSKAAQIADQARTNSQHTTQLIGKLGHSSEQIGGIIALIQTIAEQTNLLALNATIEAARAGEMGKGFAVVASEVKELAHQTAKATGDISAQVQAIREDSQAVSRSMVEIGAIINDIHQIQSEVASAIEEQTATTAEISRNITEAAKGGGEIASSISAVAAASSEAKQSLNQTSENVDTLVVLADELRAEVKIFKL